MRRRDVIRAIACSAFVRPQAAFAQPADRMRRVGVLLSVPSDDPEYRHWLAAFLQTLAQAGWVDGRNVRLDTRWTRGDEADTRRYVAELLALEPDVVLAHGASTVGPLLQATRAVPVVFAIASDPVGAGFVESLARPGGNATGFMSAEFSMGAKWLELLKEIAPTVTRVGVLRDSRQGSGAAQFAAVQTVASPLGIEARPINMGDAAEIERGVTAFAQTPHGGLIVAAGALATRHRNLIISLAARSRLPAVYYERHFAVAGGLVAYGTNFVENYKRAAGYVDRILRGQKPAELPVQAPDVYVLTLNLKTAKTLGLDPSPALLARADEIIE